MSKPWWCLITAVVVLAAFAVPSPVTSASAAGTIQIDDLFTPVAIAVPEPASLLLLGAVLVALGVCARLRVR